MPHEELAKPARDALSGDYKGGEGCGVWNWHEWAQPGDLIVIDEVQRHWRPRGMGTKPPAEIAALETHRHKGVDFILITQHPMLIDQNVRRLIGRHEHVRRIFGMQRALVYQWDGCQSDVSRLAGGTRSVFTYPKKAFELYKSSELHTKPKYKIPAFFLFPVAVVALAVVAGPSAFSALKGAATGKGITGEKTAVRAPKGAAAMEAKAGEDGGSAAASPALASSVAEKVQTAKVGTGLLGCISMGKRCSCFDLSGRAVELDQESCRVAVQTVARVVPGEGSGGGASPGVREDRQADGAGGARGSRANGNDGETQGDGVVLGISPTSPAARVPKQAGAYPQAGAVAGVTGLSGAQTVAHQ
jgi:zona occludens toxin